MIDVLVVEDSRVTRDYLVHVLEADPMLRVIDTAADGEGALASVSRRRPDVILMDLHLPGIDGLEVTGRIMASNPVPIVVCTASTRLDQVHTAMRALEAGALAVMKKPSGPGAPGAAREIAAIISTLKLMSEVKLVRRWSRTGVSVPHVAVAEPPPLALSGHGVAVVAIGASTGGPPVLAQILAGLIHPYPVPILVVQHISSGFTEGFAEWLAAAAGLPVHVARGGDRPLRGHVYVAPDDRHLRAGPRGELETSQDEPRIGPRPSAGILFRSVAERFGSRAVGVLLTGMGRDGAEELKLMADRGAITVAQDEESCAVFGMPAEAMRLGAARYVLSPRKIAELLTAVVRVA